MPSSIVRHAKREDVGVILAFMRATAAEQGVAHSVQATEAGLLASLDFADDAHDIKLSSASRRHPNGKPLVSLDTDGKITGMAIYFFTYVAWKAKSGVCLEDLYVLPEHRRGGHARRLVQAVAKEAMLADCDRMEWMCFKDNTRALSFYRGLGAKELDSISLLRLESGDVAQLAASEEVIEKIGT